MEFSYHDGGRSDAGFKGHTGDCVTRAITIATGKPYREVYDELNEVCVRFNAKQLRSIRGQSHPRTGIHKPVYHEYLMKLGWRWYPKMGIGTGCQVHLLAEELPMGILVVSLSRHLTCVIDGVIYDTHNPDRDGKRCVYGYYKKPTIINEV